MRPCQKCAILRTAYRARVVAQYLARGGSPGDVADIDAWRRAMGYDRHPGVERRDWARYCALTACDSSVRPLSRLSSDVSTNSAF